MKMFVRIMVAVLLSLAPMKVRAASPESAELAQQAARLGARATAEEDPEAAAITAFKAHNLWFRAFEADGEKVHLCKARALLAAICARPGLDDEFRASLERSRDELPRCPKSGRSQNRLKRIEPAAELPEFLDIPEPVAQVPPRVDMRDAEQPALLPRPVQAEPLDRPQRPGHALQIGGGISIALGIVVFGVMTPFAVRDAANARDIRSLTAKSIAAGGMTPEQDQRSVELAEESRSTFRSSLALGLTGGAATLLGASLLIVGHRRSAASLRISPRADRNSASISLQGRF